MILYLFIFLPFTQAASDPDCPNLVYQPCHITSHRGFKTDGFRCTTTDNATCLERNDWCKSLHNFEQGTHCSDFSNLLFDACLVLKTTIHNTDYMVIPVGTDWQIAEQYCQHEGYHLVSFETQPEFDAVVKFLQKIDNSIDRRKFERESTVEIEDPTGQRCENSHFMNWLGLYWTGLLFDSNQQTWRYTDGVSVNEGIKSKAFDLGERTLGWEKAGYMTVSSDGLQFKVHQDPPDGTQVSNMATRPRILCKKSPGTPPTKWSGQPGDKNLGCLTGFKCPDSGKCLIGASLVNSQVCNGVSDCADGSDESDSSGEPCSTFTAPFPDKTRVAHFLPLRRPVAAARKMCKSRGWFLPSVHSPADMDFLLSLPAKYAAASKKNDFRIIAQNWQKLEWNVLLGIENNGSQRWDDGSKVDHLGPKLSAFPNGADVYIDSTAKDLVSVYDPADREFSNIFVVCQERSYTGNQVAAQQKKPNSKSNRLDSSSRVVVLLLTLLGCVVSYAVML